MSSQIKRRRGTTVQHSTFIGSAGEVTVDTTKNALVVHDGILVGGYPVPKVSDLGLSVTTSRAVYGGTADAITLTTGLGLNVLTVGLEIRFRASAANTGATTINVDGIGVVSAVTSTGSALPAGLIRDDVDTVLLWDGSNLVVVRNQGAATTDSPEFLGLTVNGNNYPSAGSLSGRNLIINGSGRINTRGYTSGAATGGSNQFTRDRWFVVTSGQSLGVTGTGAGTVMTAPSGGVSQVIEGANVVGGAYVINWTGTATATVDGTARAKGDTFTLTADTNTTVKFSSGTFTDVQLERGTVATPFERVDIGLELVKCQRYYEIGSMFAQGAYVGSDWPLGASIIFSVTKRFTPTVILTVTGSGNYNSALATQGVTNSSVGFNATMNSSIGAYIFVNFTADAEIIA
mgnify:CR=1 FL=1